MIKTKNCTLISLSTLTSNRSLLQDDVRYVEAGTLEITGTGEIRVINTGGSSASEGGMGSDSDDDKSKGDLTKPGGGKDETLTSTERDSDITFDPIKKNVREAEKGQDRE